MSADTKPASGDQLKALTPGLNSPPPGGGTRQCQQLVAAAGEASEKGGKVGADGSARPRHIQVQGHHFGSYSPIHEKRTASSGPRSPAARERAGIRAPRRNAVPSGNEADDLISVGDAVSIWDADGLWAIDAISLRDGKDPHFHVQPVPDTWGRAGLVPFEKRKSSRTRS